MQLTWLGAAGFKLDTDEGATLLIDPFLSRPALARPSLSIQPADLAPVDEIFLSDGRFDHASDTPALAAQTGAIVHAVESVCQHLARQGVAAHCLQSVVAQTPKRVGSLSWQALRTKQTYPRMVKCWPTGGLHLPAHLSEWVRAWPPGEEAAYLFRLDGLSLMHFSSVGWAEAEIRHLQPDLVLLPVENQPNLDTAAAHLAAQLKPKVVIAHHWDDYCPPLSEPGNLTQFEATLKAFAPQTKVYIPTIGQIFDPIRLLWS